ncbi:uncharacterized protein TRIADDRAFT_25289, partial [Trichoplax adhaerens]
LFIESYLTTGRITNIARVMSCHPKYMKIFQETHNQLFYGPGLLPHHWRHYIAILAASRHNCLYMMQLHAEAFRLYQRDIHWLKGLSNASQKLINFEDLLNRLTYQPWTIQKEHIDELVVGESAWSISELVQAVVIVSHVVSVVGFYYGCGIHDEIDFKDGHTYSEMAANGKNDEDNLVHAMNQTKKKLDITDEEKRQKLLAVMSEYKSLQERHELLSEDKVLEEIELFFRQEKDTKISIIDNFMDNRSIEQSTDFAKLSLEDRQQMALRTQEFSWEDQGFSVVSRYYNDIIELLDEKFRIIYNLTYNKMGDTTNTDTKVLRTAVWNYIQMMKGVWDDYLYTSINKLVATDFKQYIKMVACKPEKTSQYLFHSGVYLYNGSEQVHLNLLFLESRNQAQLLHALRAIMQHSLA